MSEELPNPSQGQEPEDNSGAAGKPVEPIEGQKPSTPPLNYPTHYGGGEADQPGATTNVPDERFDGSVKQNQGDRHY